MLNPERISYADFLAYGEAHDEKFEFVNGQIIAQAKPTKRHQRLAIALGNLLAKSRAGARVRCTARLDPRTLGRERRRARSGSDGHLRSE